MTMGTLRMSYEYFFQIFTKWLLLSMHISTVSILKILFLDKLFFLIFYQNHPYQNDIIQIRMNNQGFNAEQIKRIYIQRVKLFENLFE